MGFIKGAIDAVGGTFADQKQIEEEVQILKVQ